jgi:hypothetical protein
MCREQSSASHTYRGCFATGGGRGIGLSLTTGKGCGGDSRSIIGPAGLPALKLSSCGGSSGRPGCSTMASRVDAKDGGIGGGVALVINLGGEVVEGRPGAGTLCAVLALGCVFGLVDAGDGGFALLPARIAVWLVRFATRGCGRTGGAATGFPGAAALGFGLTAGCGMTCAFASCCDVRWTI